MLLLESGDFNHSESDEISQSESIKESEGDRAEWVQVSGYANCDAEGQMAQ